MYEASILRFAGCADLGCRVAFVPVERMGRPLIRLEHLLAGSAVTFSVDVEAHPAVLLEQLRAFHVMAPPDRR